MRIAITGSSSTGKTTLAKEVSMMDNNLEYLTVDARTIIQSFNIKNIDNLTPNQFKSFQNEWIIQKKNNETFRDNFITDRSFIDSLAYMRDRDIFDNILEKECISNMLQYDIVFYIPFGNIPFQSDGYRISDISRHKKIDADIRFLLKKHHIKYFVIETLTVQDRIDYMMRIINSYE